MTTAQSKPLALSHVDYQNDDTALHAGRDVSHVVSRAKAWTTTYPAPISTRAARKARARKAEAADLVELGVERGERAAAARTKAKLALDAEVAEREALKANRQGIRIPTGPQLDHSLHLLIEARSQTWRGQGMCRDVSNWPSDETELERTERFYPGRSDGKAAIATAKAVCAQCPVREECLEWALRANERIGVWGMTTGAERRLLRRAYLVERRKELAAAGVDVVKHPGVSGRYAPGMLENEMEEAEALELSQDRGRDEGEGEVMAMDLGEVMAMDLVG